MLGPGSGHGQHIDDVLQRLADLLYKNVRFELALCIPTDLAADENLASRRGNAVGVADRLSPIPQAAGSCALVLSRFSVSAALISSGQGQALWVSSDVATIR